MISYAYEWLLASACVREIWTLTLSVVKAQCGQHADAFTVMIFDLLVIPALTWIWAIIACTSSSDGAFLPSRGECSCRWPQCRRFTAAFLELLFVWAVWGDSSSDGKQKCFCVQIIAKSTGLHFVSFLSDTQHSSIYPRWIRHIVYSRKTRQPCQYSVKSMCALASLGRVKPEHCAFILASI